MTVSPTAGAGPLAGRVAVITGAGRGIGAATARRFGHDGAAVVLADRDEQPLQAVSDAVAALGAPVATLVGDVADPDIATALVDRAIDGLGGLDVVINNAGWHHDAAFHAVTAEQWAAVEGSLYGAALATCRACVPHLRELAGAELAQQGHVARNRAIVNTGAAAFTSGEPGEAPAAAAAGAVVGLTRVLARELGGFGITVNAVVPGFVTTRVTEPEPPEGGAGMAEPLRQMMRATTALGRAGRPADVAGVHAFLASPDASFVTGATIPVTGGLLGTLT